MEDGGLRVSIMHLIVLGLTNLSLESFNKESRTMTVAASSEQYASYRETRTKGLSRENSHAL